MKRDELYDVIHRVGKSEIDLRDCTVSRIADMTNVSRSYAHRWLKHFVDTGFLVAIAVKQRNTEKHFYVANDNGVWLDIERLEKRGYQVLYVYKDGEAYLPEGF